MPSKAKVSVEDVAEAVKAQPLVGVNRAAKMLGTHPPNFKRYRDRLTEIPVEGSAAVFVKSEVAALAEQLQAERAERAGG